MFSGIGVITNVRRNALIVTGLVLIAGLARADEDPVFRSDSRLVVLHATVLDPQGNLVTNLPRRAFQVFENGIAQQIKVFRQEDQPVSMCLVIDSSASMNNKKKRVETAALDLIQASNPEDEVSLLYFHDEPILKQTFTGDVTTLRTALADLDPHGGTAMRDAINMGLYYVNQKAKREKKVLVVITDGEDNMSQHATLGTLLADAQGSGAVIHAIGILNDENAGSAKRAQKALEAIAAATGGQAYFPADINEIDLIARQIARDVRNQYTIAYSPTNQALDGSFRQIKVTVDTPRQVVVHTRSGYFASPAKAGGAGQPSDAE